jgi:hypothetical protein
MISFLVTKPRHPAGRLLRFADGHYERGHVGNGQDRKNGEYTSSSLLTILPPLSKIRCRRATPNNWIWAPKHYLEQYHAAYNPDAEALAESEGYASWQLCFAAHADRGQTTTDTAPTLRRLCCTTSTATATST